MSKSRIRLDRQGKVRWTRALEFARRSRTAHVPIMLGC